MYIISIKNILLAFLSLDKQAFYFSDLQPYVSSLLVNAPSFTKHRYSGTIWPALSDKCRDSLCKVDFFTFKLWYNKPSSRCHFLIVIHLWTFSNDLNSCQQCEILLSITECVDSLFSSFLCNMYRGGLPSSVPKLGFENMSFVWQLSWDLFLFPMMMKWCLMSSDVGWHIRDKLRSMPKNGSVNLYVQGSQKVR